MTLITYQGRAVAIADEDRVYLDPHVDRLPDGHPLKAFVGLLALYARDVLTGELPGDPWRYESAYGERYAREALIPRREFLAVCHRSDGELAARFGVPIEQIARRRRDVALCPLKDIARSRGGGYGARDRWTSRRRAGC